MRCLPLLVVLSGCLGRSEPLPFSAETVSVDLSDGLFSSTRWNEDRGWLQLTPRSSLDLAAAGLVGYFHLDRTLECATGAGTDALAHDGPVFDDGLVESAVVLDGNAWLEIPHDPRFASADLTVSLWAKPTTFDSGTIFSKDGWGDASSNLELRLTPVFNTLVLEIETPGTLHLESLSDEAQTDRWLHLVVSWGQSGTRFYVDGNLVDEDPTATDPTGNDWPILLGASGNTSRPGELTVGDDFFAGQVDEVSIWSRALTGSEVRAIYDGDSAHHGIYTSPVQDAGRDVTWTTLTWSPNRPTLRELSLGPEPTFGAGQLSTEGCLALLHLNESAPGDAPGGADVADETESHHGTVTGATFGGAGLFHRALSFDGDGDLVDLGPVNTSGSELTLSAWVYPTGWTGDDARILSKSTGEWDEDHTWMLSTVEADHFLRARLKVNGVTQVFHTTTARLVANEWSHVAITYDGAEVRFYQDGRVNQVNELIGNLAAEPSVPVAIGANPDGDYSWQGLIDEVSIWERALSETEIGHLFNRGGLRTRLRVRFCAEDNCSGDFVGPDGTTDTFYSELLTAGSDQPRVELAPIKTRYMQVQVELESDDVSFSPELRGIELQGR